MQTGKIYKYIRIFNDIRHDVCVVTEMALGFVHASISSRLWINRINFF